MADAAGQALEEPHVRAGRCQLDVAQSLTAYLGEGDFHAALVADHAPMLHPFVFSAQAFPVGHRTEDAGAEQAVPLRLEGAVIDGFGLGYFTVRPAPDFFRRCQTDADGIEVGNRIYQVKGTRTIQGVPPVPAAKYAAARGSQNEWPVFSGQQFSRPSRSGAGNGSRSFQSLKVVFADSGQSTGTDHHPLTPSLLPP